MGWININWICVYHILDFSHGRMRGRIKAKKGVAIVFYYSLRGPSILLYLKALGALL